MMFLDDNLKEVQLPKETCTKEEFKNFIHKVYYIYFSIPERMKWFQSTYRKHDEMNSIFEKRFPTLYEYDEKLDYWYAEVNINIRMAIDDIYMNRKED